MRKSRSMGIIFLFGFSFTSSTSPEAAGAPRQVLLLTYSQGFQHPCVKGEAGKPSLVEATLTALGKTHGFEVTATSDASRLSPDFLKAYDALFFYTQGDLDQPGIDKGALKKEDRKVITDFVAAGKGFVATHSGGDTFHNWFDGPEQKQKPYVDMVGAEFVTHGAQQVARISVLDRRFPACQHLPHSFEINDEWYQYKNFAEDMHVLMMLETDGMHGEMYERPSYPITWYKDHGKGRVFYTGLGHRDDVWTNPLYQTMIATAIRWAVGDVDAESAAPTYREATATAWMPKGFVRIWDGRKGFVDWKSPTDAAFSLADGSLRATGGGRGGDSFYLGQKFSDFELGLEWMAEKLSSNSGIWLRSPEAFADEQAMYKVAYEVQIQDDRDKLHRTGAIYGFAESRVDPLPTRAAGEWNQFRIRCQGDVYTVYLNDVEVTRYESKTGRSREGYIALQNHGDTVSFRSMWVRKLGPVAGK